MPAHRLRLLAVTTALAAAALGLAGCSGGAGDPPAGIQVVAATDVYGSLATTIGGAQAHVTSIIDDPDKDPHEYQADARTQLAIAKAQVIVENGGGYDDFVGTMISAAKNTKVDVIDAVKLSGYDAGAAGFNEHVFYDYPTVGKVVDAIVAAYTKADPSHSALFADRGAKLRVALDTLERSEASLAATYAGVGAAITEPVPDYVLRASGLNIVTPTAFSEAIENGTDAPAAVLAQTLATLSSGQAKVLVYNVQTGGPQTDAVLAAAEKARVPAVPVSETLPKGLTYIEWQQGVLATLGAALAG